jgi:hypothetical protein
LVVPWHCTEAQPELVRSSALQPVVDNVDKPETQKSRAQNEMRLSKLFMALLVFHKSDCVLSFAGSLRCHRARFVGAAQEYYSLQDVLNFIVGSDEERNVIPATAGA